MFQLQAAVLASRVLDPAGNTPKSLLLSYDKLATGGLYQSHDLKLGDKLLQRAGLVAVTETHHVPTPELIDICKLPDDVAAELIIQKVLLREPPLWLFAAVVEGEVRWENVPESDQDALTQLLGDAARREALLLTLGQTLDAERLAERGAHGEEYVVEACQQHLRARSRPDLAASVRRVSLQSDQLGYDVTSPDTSGHRLRMEVKTTSIASADRVEFFLSRNEATVAGRDPAWFLVAVRRERDEVLQLIGWCSANQLLPHLPHDSSRYGRWASVRLSIPTADFRPGLPLDS